ncbi:MAG TPA: ubiquinol-cytochrome c reductase iron-sulfur subunit [Pirellulales bacterium]|nr:ubiquinol-cytochrome c reductase iron-sulfur subunit [Pirellulales bacterium]
MSEPIQHTEAPAGAGRRGFLAGLIGGIVAIFPFAAGLFTFFNPLRSRKGAGAADDQPGKLVRIAPLTALPDDGVPRQFPVIADRQDAWTRLPSEAIGVVYLRRQPGSEEVEAFNATCPHAGCFVAFDRSRDVYQCPCHDSAFGVDGQRVFGPSPRDLDKLEAEVRPSDDQKELWVRYVDYYTGMEEKIPKS